MFILVAHTLFSNLLSAEMCRNFNLISNTKEATILNLMNHFFRFLAFMGHLSIFQAIHVHRHKTCKAYLTVDWKPLRASLTPLHGNVYCKAEDEASDDNHCILHFIDFPCIKY